MTRITVDESLRTKLDKFDVPVELCDEAGRTLGHFVPIKLSQRGHLELDQCPYSEEELANMHAESGGRALAEIWKSLGRA